MSAVTALIAEVRSSLESERSAEQLDVLHGKLKTCIGERSERLKAITAKDTSTFGNTPGPERQKVIAAGDIEALRRLDDEERGLGPELEVLRNLLGSLRRRLDEQRASEYADGMPQAFAELDDLLADQAAKQAIAHKARQVTEAKLKELLSQRHHVIRQNALRGQRLELPAAAPELLDMYIRINQYRYHQGPDRIGWFSPAGGPQQLKIVAGTLGVAVPRPAAMAAA